MRLVRQTEKGKGRQWRGVGELLTQFAELANVTFVQSVPIKSLPDWKRTFPPHQTRTISTSKACQQDYSGLAAVTQKVQ